MKIFENTLLTIWLIVALVTIIAILATNSLEPAYFLAIPFILTVMDSDNKWGR